MLKAHRIIWSIALLAVGVAGIVVLVRSYADESHNQRVARMFELLDADPQARRSETQAAVRAVIRHAEGPERESAELYYALGLLAHGARSYDEAEYLFRAAIARRPNWPLAHNNLGITLYSNGNAKEAEAAFQRAIGLAPDWSRPYNDLAILYRRTARLEDAEEMARRALELDPDSVDVRNNYGNLLVRMGKLEEAEAQYRAAMRIEPTHAWPHYNLACLYSLQGAHDRALERLRFAIQQHEPFREEALKDEDLDPLRGDPEFQRIIAADPVDTIPEP